MAPHHVAVAWRAPAARGPDSRDESGRTRPQWRQPPNL